MPAQPHRVEVESVHWPTLMPSLRLFESFRQAIHPAKLALGFALVVLLYLGGLGLDLAFGDQVYSLEVPRFLSESPQRFERYLEVENRIRADMIERGLELDERFGIFETFLDGQRRALDQLVGSLVTLNFGVGVGLAAAEHAGPAGGVAAGPAGGVIGALTLMLYTLPSWLLKAHPWFFWIYGAYAFALTAWIGGAISRLAALHACRDLRQTPADGLRFAGRRYLWFFLAPLIPPGLAVAAAIPLAAAGLVLFNLPWLDVAGGVLYGPLLVLGAVIALVLIGYVVAVHALYPAIAVEDADAFDAISRSYNYVVGRPVRFVVYVLVSLVYFAICYLLVSLVVYGALWCTHAAVGVGAFTEVWSGVTRFDLITMPHEAFQATAVADRPWTTATPRWLVGAWGTLLRMLLPAFAVSFYFCSSTWVYLLLRRDADGVDFDDVQLPASPDTAETAPDAGEPADA